MRCRISEKEIPKVDKTFRSSIKSGRQNGQGIL